MLPFIEIKSPDIFTYYFENFDFPQHLHSGVEIIFVEHGCIFLHINEKVYPVKKDEIAVVFPNQIHCYEHMGNRNKGSLMIIGSHLLPDYMEEFSRYHPIEPVLKIEALHQDVTYAYKTLLALDGEHPRIQKAYANLLMSRLFEEMRLTAEGSAVDDMIPKLVCFMSEHYMEPLNLEEVAKYLGISRYQLSRIFTNVFHIRFNDYLNRLRIEYAMELINSSNRTITEIAMEVGFGSIRTFHRAFKKVCNMEPKVFRIAHAHKKE